VTSVLFEVNYSRNFETSCDYRWKQVLWQQRNRQQQQVHHSRWQSFQFRFNSSSAEIVCTQPNFLIYPISWIIRISAELFPQPSMFFSDCRLGSTHESAYLRQHHVHLTLWTAIASIKSDSGLNPDHRIDPDLAVQWIAPKM